MKPIWRSIIALKHWWLSVVLVVGVLTYSLAHASFGYYDGLVGNLAATLIGVVFGVPIALHMERSRSEADASEMRKEERRIRRDALTLLVRELDDNKDRLIKRMGDNQSLPIDPLKLSTWETLKASGGIKAISDPNLLGRISDAYRLLAVLSNLEAVIYESVYGSTVMFPDGKSAAQKLIVDAMQFHMPTIHNVSIARNSIQAELDREPA